LLTEQRGAEELIWLNLVQGCLKEALFGQLIIIIIIILQILEFLGLFI
jgi:hypothetical protein